MIKKVDPKNDPPPPLSNPAFEKDSLKKRKVDFSCYDILGK